MHPIKKPIKAFFSKKLLMAVLLLISFYASSAQSYNYDGDNDLETYNRWAFRLNGGTAIFLGDVKQEPLLPSTTPYNEWRAGGSLGLEYRMSPVFSLAGKLLYSQMAGAKSKTNTYFQSDMIEGSLNLFLYPINIFSQRNGRIADIYLMGGVGVSNFNSKLYDLTTNNVLATSGHGHGMGIKGRTLEPVLSAGLGIDFLLSEKWALSIESSNKAFTNDKIDLTVSQFEFDVYNFTSIGLTYKFGAKPFKKSRSKAHIQEVEEPQEIQQPSVQIISEKTEPIAQELPVIKIEEITKPIVTEEKTIEVPAVVIPEKPPLKTGYRVQLLAASKPYDIAKLAAKTRMDQKVIEESTFNGLYIYVTEYYDNHQDAVSAMQNIRRNHSTPDAFIVYFRDGKRIGVRP